MPNHPLIDAVAPAFIVGLILLVVACLAGAFSGCARPCPCHGIMLSQHLYPGHDCSAGGALP